MALPTTGLLKYSFLCGQSVVDELVVAVVRVVVVAVVVEVAVVVVVSVVVVVMVVVVEVLVVERVVMLEVVDVVSRHSAWRTACCHCVAAPTETSEQHRTRCMALSAEHTLVALAALLPGATTC